MNISTQKVRQLRQEIRGRTIQFRTQNPVHSLSQITQESDFDNASSTIVIGITRCLSFFAVLYAVGKT
jgi:hypothetical protein